MGVLAAESPFMCTWEFVHVQMHIMEINFKVGPLAYTVGPSNHYKAVNDYLCLIV